MTKLPNCSCQLGKKNKKEIRCGKVIYYINNNLKHNYFLYKHPADNVPEA